ncbi:hypothetical protein AHF37_02517 [Paragonimus kellicotti]|nr:hypothetical protein AHF37_02517 [Paragonimus kellicotti]
MILDVNTQPASYNSGLVLDVILTLWTHCRTKFGEIFQSRTCVAERSVIWIEKSVGVSVNL